MRHLSGEYGNTNCYFKIILMLWKEPFGGFPLRKDFLAKVLEIRLWRKSFLSKVTSSRSCSFFDITVGFCKRRNKCSSYTVCNFQSRKNPVELNSLLSKFFCYITWLLYHLMRRDIGWLTNEAFTSNPIVSSKQ